MRVGVPKEIKNSEFRVGLVPGSVREYIANGHTVLVETGAGAGIRYRWRSVCGMGSTCSLVYMPATARPRARPLMSVASTRPADLPERRACSASIIASV